MACPCHKGGSKLFESEQPPRTAAPVIDMSIDKKKFDEVKGVAGKRIISWNRFKTIKEEYLWTAFDKGTNSEDPWHLISGLVDDFNANRKKWIVAETSRVLDESMSGFQPRTTKTSLLPYISYIIRKPTPLGTEYKVAVCTATGIMCYLEIQRGATPMRLKSFVSNVGSTAACSLRLTIGSVHCGLATREGVEAMEADRPHLIIADSWFGSVRLAESMKLLRRVPTDNNATPQEQTERNDYVSFHGYFIDRNATTNHKGHELIAAVKTNSGWFPKKDITSKMRDWPSGSHIVYECVAPETNVELVAIGYKYNAKKVLCFVMTKNAGSTIGGKAYKAKFPDQFGNVVSRDVFRPAILSTYFDASNLIDAHNHARQGLLGLETHWKTRNPWLRNIFTIVGMTVVDCWKALQFRLSNQFGKITVEEFANRLAYDCLNNPFNSGCAQRDRLRDDIVADGLYDVGSELSSRMGSSPSFMFGSEMTISCCRASNPSPLTADGSEQGRFQFQATAPATMDYHAAVKQRMKEKNGQASKRRCVVCKKDTRLECKHRSCQNFQRVFAGVRYIGTPVCTMVRDSIPSLGLRHNQKTCIEIHRELYAQQHTQTHR